MIGYGNLTIQTTISQELIREALSIIHSNRLTRIEIAVLVASIEPTPALGDFPNLETASRELADLILAKGLTIQQGADMFRELADMCVGKAPCGVKTIYKRQPRGFDNP